MVSAAISHFETSQRVPCLESFARLIHALEVSADSLGRTELNGSAHKDPIFLRASHAIAQTLDTVRQVTAAILEGTERERGCDKRHLKAEAVPRAENDSVKSSK